jgi:hypothetical protein
MSLSPLAIVGLLSTVIAATDTFIENGGSFEFISAFLFVFEATTNIKATEMVSGLTARYRFRQYGWPKSNALEVYREGFKGSS